MNFRKEYIGKLLSWLHRGRTIVSRLRAVVVVGREGKLRCRVGERAVLGAGAAAAVGIPGAQLRMRGEHVRRLRDAERLANR